MKQHNLYVYMIFISIIIFFYTLTQPLKRMDILKKMDFQYQPSNIEKENAPAIFRNDNNGTFFIHPGKLKATKCWFRFIKNEKLNIVFSIPKRSKVGDISFSLLKNGLEYDNFIVKSGQKYTVLVDLRAHDTITIIADKHGRINGDWGNVCITKYNLFFKFKNVVILVLFISFFIFLIKMGYIYIAIEMLVLYSLFIFSEKLQFHTLQFSILFLYLLLIVFVSFIMILIHQTMQKYRISSIVNSMILILISILPMIYIVNILNFNMTMSKDTFYAIFQTNFVESYEYLHHHMTLKDIVGIGFLLGLLILLNELQYRYKTMKLNLIWIGIINLFILTVVTIDVSQLRIINLVIKSLDNYRYELSSFQNIQEKRKNHKLKFKSIKNEKNETYIIIIGESLNKRHMGLYGYVRDTNPYLSKMYKENKIIRFDNVYSNYTHTVQVLSQALTESNQYNKKDYYTSVSIVDILNKANIDTYWVTCQNLYGTFDNMVSAIGTTSNHIKAFNKGLSITESSKYDEVVIDKIDQILNEKTDKTRVIFVHLLGNHLNYSNRYPHKKFEKFNNKIDNGYMGSLVSKNSSNVNAYDNSVLYNDYVVSSIINHLSKYKGVSGLLYMPDHAEDAIHKLEHDVRHFTFEMVQIPMLAWFSEAYKNQYKQKYNRLINRKDRLFSNDMLYDTLIGLIGVKSNKYGEKYDFTSTKYQLKDKDALVLHGKKHYMNKNNYIFWQNKNIQYLMDVNQLSKVTVFNANTVSKVYDGIKNKINAFDISIALNIKENTLYVTTTNNKKVMGLKLELFLGSIPMTKIDKMIFDFSNLDINNIKLILLKLESLNKKYDIKNKVNIQLNSMEYIDILRNYGWNISYVLKKERILSPSNNLSLKDMAENIARQITLNKIDSISFDEDLYVFVKNKLEPLIDKNIFYKVKIKTKLADSSFKKSLLKNEIFYDKRVKSLLLIYYSLYEL